jgi:hypothetical protein
VTTQHFVKKSHLCLEILSADVEQANEDPFGQVKSGCLEIRGKTSRGVVRRTYSPSGWDHLGLSGPEPERGGVHGPVGFFADSARFGENLVLFLILQDGESFSKDAKIVPNPIFRREQEDSPMHEIEVLILLVSEEVWNNGEHVSYAILLIPAEKGPAYSRVRLLEAGPYKELMGLGPTRVQPMIDRWCEEAEETVFKII